MAANIDGNAATVTVAAGTGSTNYIVFVENTTSGSLPILADTGMLYDASKNAILADSHLGALANNYADVGNVGTGEDDLYSYSVAAGRLGADGYKIVAKYTGIFVASATDTRRLKAYFGATMIYDSTAITTVADATWNLEVIVIRESSTVVRCSVVATLWPVDAAFPLVTYTRITGINLASTAYTIKITGESAGVGVANNDIVAKIGNVKCE